MNKHLWACLGVIAFTVSTPLSWAGEESAAARYGAKPLKGDYYVYGGTLADMTPPSQKDRKVALMLRGALAKELFDQIGPDAKKENACASDPDYRERRRGDRACTYSRKDGQSCYFGLNVVTGKGINGLIC